MFIHEPFSLKLKMIALKEKFQITADMKNNTKEEWRYSVLNFIWPQFKSVLLLILETEKAIEQYDL